MIAQDELVGHWQRNWIKAPGHEDYDTAVHWLQSPGIYADIRIPAVRPELGKARALCDLAAPSLGLLLAAEGFAGTIGVSNSVCEWDRTINWHGTPQGADIGHMAWDGAGRLIETGVHAEYVEQWRRRTGTPEGWLLECAGRRLYVLATQTCFIAACGTPGAAASRALVAHLATGGVDAAYLAEHFDGFYALGDWHGDAGRVTGATSPFLEGLDLLSLSDLRLGQLTTTRPDFFGIPVVQRWTPIATV